MKIISLQFKNLNSLKGEFKIDFSHPQLANAGLFAITGPTGAGKSTILDAISLALYSNTPRIGEINKNTIGDKGVIVTKGTKDAFAHIIFEANEKLYKAEWAIYLNRNGNWSDVTHKLSVLENGTITPLTEKKSDTKNLIKEIVGLDEDQFTKAIVLSQGKFDEFLRSGKNDRYELLEIITGTQIYREIGKAVYKKSNEIDTTIEEFKLQMDGIAVLGEEEIEQINEQQHTLTQQVTTLKAAVNKNEQIKQNKENILKLEKEAEQIALKTATLHQNKAALKNEIDQLNHHEKALPHQVAYNDWKNTATKISELNRQISHLMEEGKKLQQDINQLIHTVSGDLQTNITIDSFETAIEDYFIKVTKLETVIAEHQLNLQANITNYTSLYKQIPEKITEKITLFKDNIAELNKFIQLADERINKIDIPSDFSIQHFNDYIQQQTKKIIAYGKAIPLKQQIIQEEEKKKQAQYAQVNAQKETSELKQQIDRLNEQFHHQESAIQTIQAAVIANKEVMSLEAHRNQLQPGKPCPCCGSEIHPYATGLPQVNNELDSRLADMQQQQKQLTAEIRNQENQQLTTNNLLANLLKEIAQSTQNIETNHEQLKQICNELQCSTELSVEEFKQAMDQKEAQSKSLNTYKTWQDAKNPLLAYVALLEQNVQLKAELANSQQQKDQLFKGGSILKYRDDLKTKWTATHTHLATNQKSIKDNNELLESTTQQFNTLQSELVVKVTEAGFNSIEELSAAILPNNQVETIKRKQQQIQTNEIELSSNKKINEETLAAAKLQDDLPITLEEVNASISSLTNERDNHLSTLGQLQQQLLQHQQNKERIAGIIAQMSQMQQLQKHYATLNNMIGDSTGNKFNNIIQRITLRHLFNMTNQRLLTLMDRYQVDLGGDGQEDEIWVIDMYMGDEKRTINSVSGGERFVISLAMALALSDLASNNVKIDSLFIDEGFGSLSPEDLDNAISMLERMQVENEKTIGIISHVESLKERISTQIQVQKLQNGESTLQLKYNDKLVNLTV